MMATRSSRLSSNGKEYRWSDRMTGFATCNWIPSCQYFPSPNLQELRGSLMTGEKRYPIKWSMTPKGTYSPTARIIDSHEEPHGFPHVIGYGCCHAIIHSESIQRHFWFMSICFLQGDVVHSTFHYVLLEHPTEYAKDAIHHRTLYPRSRRKAEGFRGSSQEQPHARYHSNTLTLHSPVHVGSILHLVSLKT